jgi:hypothetical protein
MAWYSSVAGALGDEGVSQTAANANNMGVGVDFAGAVLACGTFTSPNITLGSGPGAVSLASRGSAGADSYVYKTSATGTLVWASQIGGMGAESTNALALDGFGNVFVAGSFTGAATFGASVGAMSVATRMQAPDASDAFVAKASSSGTFLWTFPVGGATSDEAYTIAADSATGAVVFGGTIFSTGRSTFGGNGQGAVQLDLTPLSAFITKVTPSGMLAWYSFVGGAGSMSGGADSVYGSAVDGNSGDVLITGTTFGPVSTFGAGAALVTLPIATGSYVDASDAFLARFSSMGTLRWAAMVGGIDNDEGFGTAFDASGNVAMCGTYTTAPVMYNGVDTGLVTSPSLAPASYLIKASATGTLLYALSLVAGDAVIAQSVTFTAASEPVVVGAFSSDRATFGYPASAALVLANMNPQRRQAYIIKASSSGTMMSGSALGNDAAGSVVYDSITGALVITGVVSGAPSFFGDSTVALTQGYLFSRGGNDAWVAKIWQ